MKTTAIRSFAVSAMCACLLGAAAVASAGDWHGRGYRGPVVVHGRGGYGFGLGIGVVVAPPIYEAPVVVESPYYAPRYYGPVIAPEVVIGGGGHYYRGGRYYAPRGRWR